MNATSSMNHAAKISKIAESGTSPATEALDESIVSSWNRCLSDYGIDPTEQHSGVVLESPQVKGHRERLDHLLKIADKEMQYLYESIAGSGFAVILTDASGVILHHICDPRLEREFCDAGLWVGANWGEEVEGTNGIGTCIVEKQAVTVHRDEHFRSRNIDLTCSAAPICDPRGDMIAVLDSSSCSNTDSRQAATHTRALVSISARLIENRNFLFEFRKQRVLRFHSRPEYVGLPNEAMLAVDGDDQVLACNAAATSFFNGDARSDLVGKSLTQLIDSKSLEVLQRASTSSGSLWPIRCRNTGRRFFAMWYSERDRRLVGQPETATRGARGKSESGRLDLAAVAGGDPHMRYNVRCAARIVDKNVPIVLLGETGTGKEVFAHAIHDASERADKPFVALNCSSIPESLIESELFGYKHGAFTGARREGMKGKVLLASGGTLFLDEIGDMPLQLQTRLLRCLEEREVVPLGGDKAIAVDLNVISATHRQLEELVEGGEFRDDLYYRLNGISLTLVPLRNRDDKRELILKVIELEKGCAEPISVADDAMDRLMAYRWPGNIRQLRNVMRAALALADDHVLRLADLPATVINRPRRDERERDFTVTDDAPAALRSKPLQDADSAGELNPLDVAEKEAILMALAAHCWNITNTATTLNMSRNTLYRKLKKHGLPSSKPK